MFELTREDCSHVAKPLPYPPEARRWLAQYMRKQCEAGVYRQVMRNLEPDPRVVCNFVLVA